MKGKFSDDKIDNNVKEIAHSLSFKILLKILNKKTTHNDGSSIVPNKILNLFEKTNSFIINERKGV